MRDWSTLKKLIWLRKASGGRSRSFRCRISSAEEPVSAGHEQTLPVNQPGVQGKKKAIDRVLSDESPDLMGMHDHE